MEIASFVAIELSWVALWFLVGSGYMYLRLNSRYGY